MCALCRTTCSSRRRAQIGWRVVPSTRSHEADDVIELNKWALEWWEQQLESSAEGRNARDYLKGREIAEDTRKTFRLGYAPDSWDALSTYLRQKGVSQDQIDRSGLVVKKEEGGSYDRFRGRLIFPVMDIQGKPIAFGGRTLRNEDAKYINSPETAAYIKGRNLFGLNLTRDEIRRAGFAILVEGFLDLIVPYQFGIRNVVASLGTALTPDQVKLLSRFAGKVVVNYDGDNAGVQAAKKAIETLLAEDLEVKILVLPENSDPDEFIRKSGVSEYQRQRGEAQPHIQFVIDQAVRDRKLSNPADKEAAIDEVLPYIRAVRSRIQKREYFDIAMDKLGIDRDSFNTSAWRRELWQQVRGGDRAGTPVKKGLSRATQATPAEERLLGLLFTDQDLRQGVLPMLQTEDYEDLATARIFKALLELQNENVAVNFDSLSARTEGDPLSSALLPMLLMSDSLHASNEHYAPEECIYAFRLMKLQQRIEDLKAEMASAEREGDAARVSRLSTEQVELTKRRSALMPKTEAMEVGN